jgi:CheY-like chemotaxis protein
MRDDGPVLYAEDDDNDVFLMKRAFRIAGLLNTLFVVSNGQHAIDYLAGTETYSDRLVYPLPSLVLLDLKMPLKSGFEVLSWIRSEVGMGIPVLILTSSNQPADIHQAYGIGANGFLIKPGKPDELLRMVKGMKQFWLSTR